MATHVRIVTRVLVLCIVIASLTPRGSLAQEEVQPKDQPAAKTLEGLVFDLLQLDLEENKEKTAWREQRRQIDDMVALLKAEKERLGRAIEGFEAEEKTERTEHERLASRISAMKATLLGIANSAAKAGRDILAEYEKLPAPLQEQLKTGAQLVRTRLDEKASADVSADLIVYRRGRSENAWHRSCCLLQMHSNQGLLPASSGDSTFPEVRAGGQQQGRCRFPTPFSNRPFSSTLGPALTADNAVEGLRTVVAFSHDMQRILSEVHGVKEVVAFEDKQRLEVDVLYLGGAIGFYLTPDRHHAGVLKRHGGKWTPESRDGIASHVQLALKVKRKETPPTLVSLPLNPPEAKKEGKEESDE